MKKLQLSLVFLLLIFSKNISANYKIFPSNDIKTVEQKCIETILRGIPKEKILVLADIDLTLIEFGIRNHQTNQIESICGEGAGFLSLATREICLKYTHNPAFQNITEDGGKHLQQQALRKISNYYQILRKEDLLAPIAVESEKTIQLVKLMQRNGINVMGFTARKITCKTTTQEELENAQVNLNVNPILPDEYLIMEDFSGYSNGVLYCADGLQNETKGSILCKFLTYLKENHQIEYLKIIVVDDQINMLKDTINKLSLNHPDINCTAIHYTYMHQKTANMPRITELLENRFGMTWWQLPEEDLPLPNSCTSNTYVLSSNGIES